MEPSRSATQLSTLISRIVVGKPDATIETIRAMLPETASLSDGALSQKLAYAKRHAQTKAPARSASGEGR